MLSNAFSVLATALVASTLVSGQTFTECNPTQKGTPSSHFLPYCPTAANP